MQLLLDVCNLIFFILSNAQLAASQTEPPPHYHHHPHHLGGLQNADRAAAVTLLL